MYQRIILLILFPLFGFSQAPQKINFQSILRNNNGEVVANKSVSLKISILSGSISGSSVYSETHNKTTDASGLISLQIGNGTVLSGVFANIAWGGASHFIKLEADFSGGSNYVALGAQELMSVPYALYASKSDTTSLNLVNRFSSKVNVSDTSSMLNPYLRKADAIGSVETDPVFNSSIAKGITGIDTAYWNRKLNLSDTSKMLANYRTELNNRVNVSDTASMLANYQTGLNQKVNVSDTSDMLTNYRTGLNAKAPISNPTFTGTVSGIDKNMVGLGNVDNTSDVNKPISTATQTALNNKLNISDFPLGTTPGNIQYWNGTTWVNLSPGLPGQSLIITSTGIPSWSGAAFPTLTTTSISSITSTSANGGGNISSDGGAAVSARGLVYATTSNPTLSNTLLVIGSGTGSFSGTLTGLTPNTTYYIRAYATNSAGTGYGSQINFTTNSPTIATLTTAAISSLTSSAAIVGGNISTDGGASVTARGVVYGISPNPTLANSVLSIGSGIGSFSGNITGLSSSTSYYLRAFATNSVETAYGNQITFNTFPASNPITDFDGNTYQTIQIGSQIWMKENLRVTKYRNGDSIPNVLIDRQNLVSGAQSSYLDDSYYDSNFGKLYNWYAATDVRGICPAGWHLPSPDEWQTLRNFLGERPGTQLKENNLTYWDPRWQDTPTNSSGFSARGSGIFYGPPISREIRESGRFWSNMAYDNNNALVRTLFVDQTEFSSSTLGKGYQISLRCLKD